MCLPHFNVHMQTSNLFRLRNLGIVLAVIVVISPAIVVIWTIGIPRSKIPLFFNMEIRAACQVPLEPAVHIDIADAKQKNSALVSPDSDVRLAIQLFPKLLQTHEPNCTSVSVFSDKQLLHPAVTKYLPAFDASNRPWYLWFYTNTIGDTGVYEETFLDWNKEDTGITLDESQLSEFAGAITFEMKNVMDYESIDTRSFSFSIYIDGTTTKIKEPVIVGVSINIPSNLKLAQDLSIPAPVNILATNYGSRYEFLLVENLVGNSANSGHWASLRAVMQHTLWAKWREYTLFFMSGLFGFGIGFLLEALLARLK